MAMAMASALPLRLPLPLLAPRAVSISAGPASPHLRSRRLAFRLRLSLRRPAALSAPSAVQPREAGRVHSLRAASCCSPAAGAVGGGANDWRMFLAWYLMALDKNPIVIKAPTSAVLALAGDLICQLVIDRVPDLDFFIFSPIFIIVFTSSLVTLEGNPFLVVPKLKQEWLSTVLANWQLWIPFQFLNFYFVAQKFQVLAANFVCLAWSVIFSFIAHKEVVAK